MSDIQGALCLQAPTRYAHAVMELLLLLSGAAEGEAGVESVPPLVLALRQQLAQRAVSKRQLKKELGARKNSRVSSKQLYRALKRLGVRGRKRIQARALAGGERGERVVHAPGSGGCARGLARG